MSQQFRKELERELTTRCKDIGFKKKKYNFYKPINESIYATLGFGISNHGIKGNCLVNVVVGVYCKDVVDLFMQLIVGKVGTVYPIMGIQLGYLMPEATFKEWNFIEGVNNDIVFEDLFMNIKTYGFQYQERLNKFDRLLQAFEKMEPGISNYERDRYLPILYYLCGDKQKGEEVIKTAITRQKTTFSDEELKKKNNRETLVLCAGSDKVDDKDFDKLLKKLPSGGSIMIVGSGVGKVSPEYFKFAERYKLLE